MFNNELLYGLTPDARAEDDIFLHLQNIFVWIQLFHFQSHTIFEQWYTLITVTCILISKIILLIFINTIFYNVFIRLGRYKVYVVTHVMILKKNKKKKNNNNKKTTKHYRPECMFILVTCSIRLYFMKLILLIKIILNLYYGLDPDFKGEIPQTPLRYSWVDIRYMCLHNNWFSNKIFNIKILHIIWTLLQNFIVIRK